MWNLTRCHNESARFFAVRPVMEVMRASYLLATTDTALQSWTRTFVRINMPEKITVRHLY